LRFTYSIDDHGPQHCISALTPEGVPNEFGDDEVLTPDPRVRPRRRRRPG
jgi:hypothetical protein